MLDWDFDDLIEDMSESMEEFNSTTDPRDLIASSLDYYEELLIEGEVERIAAILLMFIEVFKNSLMTTFDYEVLNETIKNYSLMDKKKFTSYQREKLEEMIKFYTENISKIKLWGWDKERNEKYYQVVLDEEGKQILLEIQEENNKEEIMLNNKMKYPELSDFISKCKKTKDFNNINFLELIGNISNLSLNTSKEKLELICEINNTIWDFPYYDIRDEERKMNLDGRYERKKILEGLVKKLNIDNSEIVNYKDIEEIKRKIKIYDLKNEISNDDFLTLYNLINSFYNEIMEKICNEKFYIWCDYKKKLSLNKTEEVEEEYQKLLKINKNEKNMEIEKFSEILKSLGLEV